MKIYFKLSKNFFLIKKNSYSTSTSNTTSTDYYNLLGVSQKASAKEIKLGYYKKAKQFHPDTNADKSNIKDKENKFKEITNAYQILSNNESKRKYDENFAYDLKYNANSANNYNTGNAYKNARSSYYTHHSNADQSAYRNYFYQNYSRRDNPYAEGFYNEKKYSYKGRENTEDKKNKDKWNNMNDNCFIYRDPYTGKYYRINPAHYSNYGHNTTNNRYYDNIYNESNNRQNSYSPYNDDYDEEEELSLGLHHIAMFLAIATSMIIYFVYRANKTSIDNKDNIIFYKNSIYYPNGRDPILTYRDPYSKIILEKK